MNNNDVKRCKDFMAMPKNLAKWIKDNYTYVVVAGDSEPPLGNWIDCHARGDSLLHGRFLIDSEQKMWRFPSERESREALDEILNWVVEYHFHEDRSFGIGYVKAEIKIEDSFKKTKDAFKDISHDEEKYLATSLIEKVAMPCGDYDEDFDDPSSTFNFDFVLAKDRVCFNSAFRI